MQTTIITATTPLAKKYTPTSTEAVANMLAGRADCQEVHSMAAFADLLDTLGECQAITLGRPAEVPAELTTRAWEPLTPGAVARTNDNFRYPGGPAPFVLDLDGLSDSVRSLSDALDLVEHCHPWIRDVTRLARPSSSSFVDGRGLRGVHVWITLSDGQDIPELGARAKVEEWNAGRGYIKISRSGAQLVRQLTDNLVYQPSRLMFEARPILDGVSRVIPAGQDRLIRQPQPSARTPAHVDSYGRLVVPNLPKLKALDQRRAETAIDAARKATRKQAVQVAAAWLEERGLAGDALAAGLDAVLRGEPLPLDWPLVFDDGTEATVYDIVRDPAAFENRSCCCPFDTKNRPGKAEIVLVDGKPRIWSHRIWDYIPLPDTLHRTPMHPYVRAARMLAGTLDYPETGSTKYTPSATVLFGMRAVLEHAGLMPWTDELTGQAFDDDLGGAVPFDLLQMHSALCVLGLYNVSSSQIKGAFSDLQAATLRNPLRDRVQSLRWDGVARLDRLLVDGYGADDTPATIAMTQAYLSAVCMRILSPGCEAPYMPLFWGGQGVGKSHFVQSVARALGMGHPANLHWSRDDRDMKMTCRRGIVVEMAEMAGFSDRESEKVKSFISESSDTYRQPYGRDCVQIDRAYTLAGTSNRCHIHRDDTGNRRIFPIQFRHRCDEPIELLMPQLLAEARDRFCRDPLIYADLVARTVELVSAENAVSMRAGVGVAPSELDDILPRLVTGTTCRPVSVWRQIIGTHKAYARTTLVQVRTWLGIRGWTDHGHTGMTGPLLSALDDGDSPASGLQHLLTDRPE
jgi:hypothetical protein